MQCPPSRDPKHDLRTRPCPNYSKWNKWTYFIFPHFSLKIHACTTCIILTFTYFHNIQMVAFWQRSSEAEAESIRLFPLVTLVFDCPDRPLCRPFAGKGFSTSLAENGQVETKSVTVTRRSWWVLPCEVSDHAFLSVIHLRDIFFVAVPSKLFLHAARSPPHTIRCTLFDPISTVFSWLCLIFWVPKHLILGAQFKLHMSLASKCVLDNAFVMLASVSSILYFYTVSLYPLHPRIECFGSL